MLVRRRARCGGDGPLSDARVGCAALQLEIDKKHYEVKFQVVSGASVSAIILRQLSASTLSLSRSLALSFFLFISLSLSLSPTHFISLYLSRFTCNALRNLQGVPIFQRTRRRQWHCMNLLSQSSARIPLTVSIELWVSLLPTDAAAAAHAASPRHACPW